jgi:hypothetical protein
MTVMAEFKNIGRTYQRANPWPDLIMAMLAVNTFSLAKVFALFEALDAQNLFDPENLVRWDTGEIASKLKTAGYDRGPELTSILAERLWSLRTLGHDVAVSEAILAHGSKREVEALLGGVNGIGPMVLENFLLLRG